MSCRLVLLEVFAEACFDQLWVSSEVVAFLTHFSIRFLIPPPTKPCSIFSFSPIEWTVLLFSHGLSGVGPPTIQSCCSLAGPLQSNGFIRSTTSVTLALFPIYLFLYDS